MTTTTHLARGLVVLIMAALLSTLFATEPAQAAVVNDPPEEVVMLMMLTPTTLAPGATAEFELQRQGGALPAATYTFEVDSPPGSGPVLLGPPGNIRVPLDAGQTTAAFAVRVSESQPLQPDSLVTVTLLGDNPQSHRFAVDISLPPAVTGGAVNGAPMITANFAGVSEGGSFEVTVTRGLSGRPDHTAEDFEIDVEFAPTGINPASDSDVIAPALPAIEDGRFRVTVPAGAQSTSFTLVTAIDQLDEPNETFSLSLRSTVDTGFPLQLPPLDLTIVERVVGPPIGGGAGGVGEAPTISAFATEVPEGESFVVIIGAPLALVTSSSNIKLVIDILISGSGAHPASTTDFAPPPGLSVVGPGRFQTVVPAGQPSVAFELPTLIDDLDEANETLTLELRPPLTAQTGPNGIGVIPAVELTILDTNEPVVEVQPVDEPAAPPVDATGTTGAAGEPDDTPLTNTGPADDPAPASQPARARTILLPAPEPTRDPISGPLVSGPISMTRNGRSLTITLPGHLQVWLDPNGTVRLTANGATVASAAGLPGTMTATIPEGQPMPQSLMLTGKLSNGAPYSEVIPVG